MKISGCAYLVSFIVLFTTDVAPMHLTSTRFELIFKHQIKINKRRSEKKISKRNRRRGKERREVEGKNIEAGPSRRAPHPEVTR